VIFIMEEKRFVAVVGCQHYLGYGLFKPGQKVKLVKELDDDYDSEAIKVELEAVGKVGYVANSTRTVPKGCCSGGRVYDTFEDAIAGVVRFVVDGSGVIVEVEENKV
jgi:hypothetical protein